MRLEVTRRADLAVRALQHLGRSGARVKGPALADALGTTPAFVTQVVAPLVRAGWVRSDPGPTGGYRLATNLAGVSVLQVIEAVDGVTDVGRCVVEDRACDGAHPCALHTAWGRARAELTRTLAGLALTDLPDRPHPEVPVP